MSLTGATLQRLQSRAAQADQLVAQLRAQLALLKKNAAVSACQAEEKKLQDENIQLKQEVNKLKQKLVQAELKNGVKQVPLPNQSSHPPAAAAAVTKEASPPQEKIKADEQKPKQANDKKQAKKADKKGGGEAKAKPQQPAEPAAPIDVSRLDMRIGFIASAKKHPDADGLYVEEVDLGEERPRTIISGLVKHVPLEQMQQRYAIFLCNLKPAKMRGIMSEGMIMCGSTPELVEIIVPPEGVVKGERVVVDDYPGEPDSLLNPKKKIWEQIQPDLKIDADGLASYKGKLWRVEGKGTCKVPNLRNSPIK